MKLGLGGGGSYYYGVEAADAINVLGANGSQGLEPAEVGVGPSPVDVIGGILGCFIIVPADVWVVGGVPSTSDGYGFFPKRFDMSHVEEPEAGGDTDVDGYSGVVFGARMSISM